MEKNGVGLLVLSHVYRVQWLKQLCEHGLAARLTPGNVVDVMKISRDCDAQWLYQKCLKTAAKDLAAVKRSDGWKFVEKNDRSLAHEILHSLQEAEQRKKRWRREREYQKLYMQLSEAMDCLQNSFINSEMNNADSQDGRTPAKKTCPNTRFGRCEACEGLEHLTRHLSSCNKKLSSRGCIHCKRMWQLLQLHSSICDLSGSCKVPLCKQFKLAMESQKDDHMWRLLVKKVVSARVMSSLTKRRRPQLVKESWETYQNTNKLDFDSL